MKYSLYHPDWRDIIRPSILKRDNYKCCVCGVRHKSRVFKTTSGAYVELDELMEVWAKQQNKRVHTLHLQVAHLDHNKNNNDPSNLRTLCPVHHAKYDSNHKTLSRVAYRSKIEQEQNLFKVQPSEENYNLIPLIKAELYEAVNVKFSTNEVQKITDIVVYHLRQKFKL